MPYLNGGFLLALVLMFMPMSSPAKSTWQDRIRALAASAEFRNSWGNPSWVPDTWNHVSDQSYWIMDKIKPQNADDEAIVMVYAARAIVPHGGKFCATQLRSRNEGKNGCPKIWTSYQQPDGDVDKTCFWLCEPGYSGAGCKRKPVTDAESCAYTKMTKENIASFVQYNQTGDWDRNEVESAMRGNGNQAFFVFGAGKPKSGNEFDVILAAKSFLENGRGIVASPASFTAHGGFWSAADYSDQYTKCKSGNSNLTITDTNAHYRTKILCMPGFDGEDCTTTYCKTCDDALAKYNDKTGSCSDCIENHIRNKEGKCEKCPAGTTAVQDKKICLECKKTEYVKDGECVPRDVIEKSVLYNCYPNENANDFKACVSSTCTNDAKVKCVTAQKQIGTKKCTGGKWGTCTK